MLKMLKTFNFELLKTQKAEFSTSGLLKVLKSCRKNRFFKRLSIGENSKRAKKCCGKFKMSTKNPKKK